MFIPWDASEGKEWVNKTNQWNDRRPNKFTIVTYDPAVNDNSHLLTASSNPSAEIYIRGHGRPGAPYIQVKVDTGGRAPDERKLPIEDACQRLIDSGLAPAYPGVIKFYSCYSGTKPIASVLENDRQAAETHNAIWKRGLEAKKITPEDYNKMKMIPPKDQSMAGQGADYFRSKGFRQCIFYGYLGPLGSNYEQDESNGEWHKVVGAQRPACSTAEPGGQDEVSPLGGTNPRLIRGSVADPRPPPPGRGERRQVSF